ncbi:PsbP domain-containing protein 3, chloroplastic [Coccomyxa sp. Obi]|nr:PsbP domain-containing protein 3, chloroplastic [Coccomyxa sp. Obi]
MELNLHSLCAHNRLLQASSRRPGSAFKSVLQTGPSVKSPKNLYHRITAESPAATSQDCRSLTLDRRALLTAGASLALGLAVSPSLAGDELIPFEDASDKFKISVPEGWVAAQGAAPGNKGFSGATGTRRALAWYPEGGTDTNVTVLVTNVGADYTALGSFGSADSFGENLIASLDRSFLLRGGFNRPQSVQKAKLLDAKSRSGMYFLEYTVQKPEETEPRHFLSAVALGFNGRYNRFYTLTAQCPEADVPTYRSTLEGVINSFRPPAPAI